MRKRIGIVTHRYAQPLFYALKKLPEKEFSLIEDIPARLAILLRQNNLDGAFLSPFDYAKDYQTYRIS